LGASTKVHALVDALGNPVRLLLSEGQQHEIKFAPELLAPVVNAYVCADRAYDAEHLISLLQAHGCTPVIPSNHRNRPGRPTRQGRRLIDGHLYKERHLVENFFQRIKRFRRIATRFDKLARNFMAFLHLAAILVWLH
jgi:transposase